MNIIVKAQKVLDWLINRATISGNGAGHFSEKAVHPKSVTENRFYESAKFVVEPGRKIAAMTTFAFRLIPFQQVPRSTLKDSSILF